MLKLPQETLEREEIQTLDRLAKQQLQSSANLMEWEVYIEGVTDIMFAFHPNGDRETGLDYAIWADYLEELGNLYFGVM